jgi:hypothetical protein
MPSLGRRVKHVVEGKNLPHLDGLEIEELGQVTRVLLIEVSLLSLNEIDGRKEGPSLFLVARKERFDLLSGLRQHRV